jgi:arylsulfatase A-like enzyme
VVALYDAGVRWVDTQIARLVESLRASGKWNDSLFVITADHGEEFLEHDGRYHAPLKLTEELIRVPLLLRYPGIDQACTADSPFSLLHLAPTLLDAMNLPGPGSFRGRSYWKRLQNREEWDEAVIVECVSGCTNPFQLASRLAPRILVVREKQYKLVINFAAATEQMYDLRHDQAELHPLAKDEQKPVRARLLRRAAKHLAESSQSRDPEHCLNARLRDLQLELAHS